ncbi:hypothetical protein M427DRAFT_41582 [Gonapodya prolifera JEL478]|uniref:Uncharacterized protein n=1 Tax=Gonapodya prolifera (strain JEL478) TaxID=1344416 RepID=A0A139ASX2_GONPJ|nr:hypothetical protein M427DRAFT_41582 [Gonapodya prolifera JEL478]|eukprot:KXS19653.1 hypothetical protein M427DRAFT_41582 [Gonapodya prolifera JEL478]
MVLIVGAGSVRGQRKITMHDQLNATGGVTIGQDINMPNAGYIRVGNGSVGRKGILGTVANNDRFYVGGDAWSDEKGGLFLNTGDNGNEPIVARHWVGNDNARNGTQLSREAYLVDWNGDTVLPGQLKNSRR